MLNTLEKLNLSSPNKWEIESVDGLAPRMQYIHGVGMANESVVFGGFVGQQLLCILLY